MTAESTKFERQIHRIHELIEQEGSAVTWNDQIKDPDSPNQNRQIDISIRRDGKLTLVECRIRRKPQDVMWIEELIGRRQSLLADAIIAVSNSGFTRGAIDKARSFGIILRDLKHLSQQEIQSWGHSTNVNLVFFEYTGMRIGLHVEARGKVPITSVIIEELEKSDVIYRIIDTVANIFSDRVSVGDSGTLKTQFGMDGLRVCGFDIKKVDFESHIRQIPKRIEIPSVVAYDAPGLKPKDRKVVIEQGDNFDFEIVQSSNDVCVAVDLSSISCPPNSQFRFIELDFGREVNMKAFEVLAPPSWNISIHNICIRVFSYFNPS